MKAKSVYWKRITNYFSFLWSSGVGFDVFKWKTLKLFNDFTTKKMYFDFDVTLASGDLNVNVFVFLLNEFDSG